MTNSTLQIAVNPLLDLISRLNARKTGDLQWEAKCPAHEDQTASLCLSKGDKHAVVMFCQAGCSTKEVLAAVGMSWDDLMPKTSDPPSAKKKIIATYDYLNGSGELEFQVVRFEPKDFRQRRKDENGKWIWNRKGVKDVLYRLPEIHSSPDKMVLLLEGEKDVDNAVEKLGVIATTNAGGAKKFRKHHAEMLRGRSVTLVPDNDPAGQKHVKVAAGLLVGIAKSVSIVDLPVKNKGDISDWITAGGTKDKLSKLIKPFKEKKTNVIESVSDPHRLARVNLNDYWGEKNRKLVYWNQTWMVWKNGCYFEMPKDHLTARVTSSVKKEFDRQWEFEFEEYEFWKDSSKYEESKDKGPPKARKVTSSLVNNVIEAMRSMVVIPCHAKMNSWLTKDEKKDESNGTLISMKNGILNLDKLLKSSGDTQENDILMSHSEDWFTMSQLDFSFDEKAICPRWVDFLNDVFNNDIEAIRALQKWFGYLITNDNSLNKILMVIGQQRSGKGTVLRVLKGLIGDRNIATPTLTEIGTQFGLQSMIGKTSAIVTDARMGDRADQSSITERLLSISGGDPQNVQRKFRETLPGFQINVRFTIFSNMLPMLKDVSSAFLSRCIFIVMPNCYLGREDFELQDRLIEELPGIFNWAILGRLNLNKENRICQPKSGTPALNELKSIISPLLSFTQDLCEFGSDKSEDVQVMFDSWTEWCRENFVNFPGNVQSFSRKLKAVMPTIDTRQYRNESGDSRRRKFTGVGLRKESDDTWPQ